MFIIKRPAIWVAAVLLISYILIYLISGDKIYHKQYVFDDLLKNNEKINTSITGEFVSSQTGETSVQIILRYVNVEVHKISDSDIANKYYLPAIVLYTDNAPQNINPGNLIDCNASLTAIKTATNPGEFDLKKYYREKKIYYMALCSEKDIKIINHKNDVVKTFLFRLRDRMKKVYIECLPKKEAGTITAMLLGDKSFIDENERELYRQNGIGHLLAISGLHVTILCMAFRKLLFRLKINEKISVCLIMIFLILYGIMTSFSISTSRAVVMMILALIARITGRSYDTLSAMAVSAVIIIIQKPFALFSCSFLLSYGAIIAIAVLYPFFDKNLISEKNMKTTHNAKEKFIDYILIELKKSLLISFSIQFFTLPIVLFYYYETPTYGLILNIIVLPFLNILVISGALGGIIGIFFLPIGRFLLGTVYLILRIFEKCCNLFNFLPFHTVVTGRPPIYKIILFYFIIITLIFILNKTDTLFFKNNAARSHLQSDMAYLSYSLKNKGIVTPFVMLILLFLILAPSGTRTFNISFLDIGQGDCIIMKSDSGKVYLIDGGSSTKKNIGKYTIIPYLKYYGINKIDYCIITHSDIDHVSGIIEILEQKQESGIQINNFLLPDPDISLKDETYNYILQLACNNCKKVSYIKQFDVINDKNLKIICLHPESGYKAESANAYSTVLSITHNSENILLTGDLEKDGEENVLNILNRFKNIFPKSYTILKAAHHGSKNSTSDEFLKRVKPQITIISCGKNNKYGHPHPELLERLKKINTIIFRTDINGAIILPLDNHTKV